MVLARKISNTGTRSLIGKFPSLKTGRVVWYESLLERDYMYLLEIDSDVISYWEQPGRIYYTLDGRRHHYTPDLLVERRREKQIVEVKPKKKAEEEKYRRLFRVAGESCRKEGYEFRVATDEMIRLQPRLNGVKLLYKYARTPLLPQHQIGCHEFFTVRQEAPLGEVTRFFASRGIGQQVVYALIFRGVLSVDLMRPLTREAVVRLSIPAYAERKVS
jgi:hypothetical protein